MSFHPLILFILNISPLSKINQNILFTFPSTTARGAKKIIERPMKFIEIADILQTPPHPEIEMKMPQKNILFEYNYKPYLNNNCQTHKALPKIDTQRLILIS